MGGWKSFPSSPPPCSWSFALHSIVQCLAVPIHLTYLDKCAMSHPAEGIPSVQQCAGLGTRGVCSGAVVRPFIKRRLRLCWPRQAGRLS